MEKNHEKKIADQEKQRISGSISKRKILCESAIYCLCFKKTDQPYFRIGLSVSKKIGNAVTRNRIKRYIRQAFLELKEQIHSGNDYVIIARKPAADMDFHEVKKSITHVLKVARVFKSIERGNNEKH